MLRDVEIGIGSIGRPPCGIKSIWVGALNAEEIQSPYLIGMKCGSKAAEGNRQFGGPDRSICIDADAALEVAIKNRLMPAINVEIQPVAVGADFKFLIMPRIVGAGPDEYFRYVPQPELIPAALAVVVDIDRAIAAEKLNEQDFVGPKESRLGFTLRVCVLAAPIGAKGDVRRFLPSQRSRKACAS